MEHILGVNNNANITYDVVDMEAVHIDAIFFYILIHSLLVLKI
ncbi:hypothetical protein [Shewanella sp. 4t3-1-2LB]|nr:hypothetical protein [Shewanella sp. 4t3-1-2LB]